MDFLSCQNRRVAGETPAPEMDVILNAEGKHAVIIGGGDTGSDCVGTCHRQGARSVTSFELLPQPPEDRPDRSTLALLAHAAQNQQLPRGRG